MWQQTVVNNFNETETFRIGNKNFERTRGSMREESGA